MFDSPFNAVQNANGVTLGYTANSNSYVLTEGPSVNSTLQQPLLVGLGPDAENTSYAHCGRWLNAAWRDDSGVVHGYFHQEWHCDYADDLYTNKSVGYAVSYDNGLTFNFTSPPGSAANQILAGGNSTTTHETGEGDHGVTRFGDYLYMYFLEWDSIPSIHGGTSVGVARSHISDAGVPGTWWKRYNGTWDSNSPAVGGPADTVWPPGTAVYTVPAVSELISVGVVFSAPLAVSWSPDGLDWTSATAGPMFTAGWSDWNRNVNSTELYGYPGLSAPQGTNDGLPVNSTCYVYFTYLAAGSDFSHRWLVRRPLDFYQGSTAWGTAPAALEAISVWRSNNTAEPRTWAGTGPVPPDAGFDLVQASAGWLVTSQLPTPAPVLVELVECGWKLPPTGPAGWIVQGVALAMPSECGAGPFAGGVVLRPAGYAASSKADAEALGWGSVSRPGGGSTQSPVTPQALWRCKRSLNGQEDYSVTLGEASCGSAGAGFGPDVQLGWAFGPAPA